MCSSPTDCCSLRCCRPLPAAGGALTCPGGELPSSICDAALPSVWPSSHLLAPPPGQREPSQLREGPPTDWASSLSSDSEDGSHSSLESEMGRGSSWTRPCPQVPPLLTTLALTPRLHSDSAFLACSASGGAWLPSVLSPSYRSLRCLHKTSGPHPIFTGLLLPDSAPLASFLAITGLARCPPELGPAPRCCLCKECHRHFSSERRLTFSLRPGTMTPLARASVHSFLGAPLTSVASSLHRPPRVIAFTCFPCWPGGP